MTTTIQTETPTGVDPRRWLALVVIAVAQLIVVLDASIVNIALPSAQDALGISDANRQWVVTAYALAFGGLLLLGGRIADFIGRKRAFIIGLVGFGVASAIGGLAQNQGELFAARALQGAFAALMAPAALSLITVTFTEPKERAKAFGVYGGISGGGAALGLILGGVLTEYASWRWTLLVNTPIAIATAVAAALLVRESRAEGKPRYDIPGVVTSTLGLVALVYGFTKANESGWTADQHDPPAGRGRRPARRVRPDRAEHRRAAAARPGLPRAQPRWRVPGRRCCSASRCSACSCSSSTTCRARCTTRP